MQRYRLTQFSPGAGCGCKIAPRELETILRCEGEPARFAELLVGNESSDDAAVYDIGDGRAVISTTDFFTPIVDDARDFGRIAATNAISDIYAMGGSPLMAIAILAWPLDTLPAELAREVIEGAREICAAARIPLAGGHSINISVPVFGLAVTGIVEGAQVKQNNSAEAGCRVFLTKPLGIGLVTTAEKRGVVQPADAAEALRLMTTPNVAGADFARLDGVRAMTDVTGFGLAGHAVEMAAGSGVRMTVEAGRLPRIEGVEGYIASGCSPGGTARNWSSYGHKVEIRASDERAAESIKALVCDPQTSGGLLVAVRPDAVGEFERAAALSSTPVYEIGRMVEMPAVAAGGNRPATAPDPAAIPPAPAWVVVEG